MPVHNVISGCYPFVECIILALPLVDELIVYDGGSTDGTIEVIEKLAKLNNAIKLVKLKFKPSKNWRNIDEGFEYCMHNVASGDWIIAFHADEFFQEKDSKKILKAIYNADEKKYNCIRHSMYHISEYEILDTFNWLPVRIFRNLPNVKAYDGIDTFYFEESNEYYRDNMYRGNLPPEIKIEITSHHIGELFEYGEFVTNRRHVQFYGIDSDTSRLKSYLDQKASFGINEEDEDFDVEKINFKPVDPGFFQDGVPEIMKGLAGKLRYEVREELYEIVKNIKKTTI